MSEIPTDSEEEAANWLIKHFQKKVDSFISNFLIIVA